MLEDYTVDEFEDCIKEISDRYNEVKADVKEITGILVDDIKYMDDIMNKVSHYKQHAHADYLDILAEFARSLFYFQKDSGMVYSIPLMQLIMYINTFFNSCQCRFKKVFTT